MGKRKPRPKPSVQFSATIGDLCFYQRNGKTYMRETKALDRELVLTDERFEKTRQHASKMGQASKIASVIYKDLPQELKARWVFRSITGHVASLLYEGEHPENVKETLYIKYIENPQSQLQEVSDSYRTSANYRETKAKDMLKKLFLERWQDTGKKGDFSLAWDEPRAYNADHRKHFNHLYEFLIERFNNLPEISIETDLGKTFTTKQLHKLLST
jgi:hypothetical protein